MNGVNHFLICKEVRSTKDRDTCIVGLLINIPAGKIGGEGASVVQVIEEAKLPQDIQVAFDTAEKQLVGIGYKPIAYIGSQIVKGVNHYFICQAKGIYPNAQPYAVIMCVNVFEKNVSVVGIAPIPKTPDDMICGYAFTW